MDTTPWWAEPSTSRTAWHRVVGTTTLEPRRTTPLTRQILKHITIVLEAEWEEERTEAQENTLMVLKAVCDTAETAASIEATQSSGSWSYSSVSAGNKVISSLFE